MKVIHFCYSGALFISLQRHERMKREHSVIVEFIFHCAAHVFPRSAFIVMEGEGGLHWNNNKSVPLNTLDNSRALAFTEVQRWALRALRALYF